MMLSIRGLYQILAYVYEIINAYSIKSLMVVPFMNLLKSTLSPMVYVAMHEKTTCKFLREPKQQT